MAKGQRCPRCGRPTFQPEGQVRQCSDEDCGVVGWLGDGPTNTPRRGVECGSCGAGTMKQVVEFEDGSSIYHCFSCSAVYYWLP
jgi:ribosomal protein L37E